jgi:hypothetical protein
LKALNHRPVFALESAPIVAKSIANRLQTSLFDCDLHGFQFGIHEKLTRSSARIKREFTARSRINDESTLRQRYFELALTNEGAGMGKLKDCPILQK